MAKELRTKIINIIFTVILVVACFWTFPCKMKFHATRDDFIKVEDTSFKNICSHETRFEICEPKIDATWDF